jgi:alpha-ketoglutarate-dependent taurine dioxygenase
MGAKKIQFTNFESFGLEAKVIQAKTNFGLQVSPKQNGALPFELLKSGKSIFEGLLLEHGAIVFKGFSFDREQFKLLSDLIAPSLSAEYFGGTSPRAKHNGVYESTFFPPGSTISQHLEMAYFNFWPMKLFFFCDVPSATGGETPFCDNRLFTRTLDKSTLKRIETAKVLYVRNYFDRPGFNSWERSFQTQDKRFVEKFCNDNQIAFEWLAQEGLRTKNIAQGTAVHPATKERLWFNHAYSLSVRSDNPEILTPSARLFLTGVPPEAKHSLQSCPSEDLPYNTYYADTQKPFEASLLEQIHKFYEENQVQFTWDRGDVLLIDNMLATHGRKPFSGERRVLVDIKEITRPYDK